MNELKQVRDAFIVGCHGCLSPEIEQFILDRLSAPVGVKKIEGLEGAIKDANKIWTKTSPSLFGGIACKNNEEADAILQAARAYLELQNGAPTPAPQGWKLVPIEPTLEMRLEGEKVVPRPCNWFDIHHADDVYSAMLSAAPTPAPTEIDLESLKNECCEDYYNDSYFDPNRPEVNAIESTIDHLAATGRLKV